MEEICRSPFPHMILYDFIPESLLSNVIKEYNHLLDEKKTNGSITIIQSNINSHTTR